MPAKPSKPYHPIFFSIFPVFSMAASNIGALGPASIWRALLVTLGFGLLVYLLAAFLIRDWGKAGLFSTLIILLAATYGHAYLSLVQVQIDGSKLNPGPALTGLWAAIFLLGAWAILRVLKNAAAATTLLNGISLALCVPVTLFVLVKFGIAALRSPQVQAAPAPVETPAPNAQTPDIYLIILDGYARADVLSELYGYDNRPFLEFLRSRGFYVVPNAHSNYSQTRLSVPSLLNYGYLDDLLGPVPEDETDNQPLYDLMAGNKAQAELAKRGYRIISFSSDYYMMELKNVDRRLGGEDLKDFEETYFKSTIALLFLDKVFPPLEREARLAQIQDLQDLIDEPSPKFVFFHFMGPHPPFLFGPNGEVTNEWSFGDGPGYMYDKDQYLERYPDQVRYLNPYFERVVDRLLRDSKTEPIILVLGDHGPGAYLDWDSAENSCFKERMSILSAYHLPGEGAARLYDSITPVNVFRIIFDEYFGAGLSLLDDRSYFSTWEKPYQWIDVTGKDGRCPEDS